MDNLEEELELAKAELSALQANMGTQIQSARDEALGVLKITGIIVYMMLRPPNKAQSKVVERERERLPQMMFSP